MGSHHRVRSVELDWSLSAFGHGTSTEVEVYFPFSRHVKQDVVDSEVPCPDALDPRCDVHAMIVIRHPCVEGELDLLESITDQCGRDASASVVDFDLEGKRLIERDRDWRGGKDHPVALIVAADAGRVEERARPFGFRAARIAGWGIAANGSDGRAYPEGEKPAV